MRPLHRAAALLLLLLASLPASALMTPDYELLDAALLRHVRAGVVDYSGLRDDPAFAQFLGQVAAADEIPPEQTADRLAFFINAYNALAISNVLDGLSMESAGQRRRFMRQRHEVMNRPLSLAAISEEILPALAEPRVHFALSCAALACARLWHRAYSPEELESQLEAAARRFVNDRTRNRLEPAQRLAFLSPVWRDHGAAFEDAAGSLTGYLAAYVSDAELAAALREEDWELRFLRPEWLLNGYLND